MRVSLAVKFTLAIALCAVLLGAAIPILDPPSHSVDLRPAIPLFFGAVLIFVIWIATYARWVMREIRRH
jgi:O-antigen/teichoic acid export membrane protein